ncbi:hypothetical protein P0Y43_02520 [Pseudomonas entomophila]|uniref:hypothetical protein n=1 Tax=Pseudomonas entomophila TaxID=312306 RepID=UPI0023D871DD|nr:hypothetical protein [Pseudomonas entomophila]MDF0729601.1 hypothetical protein [Pseudomonas entomophila]
MMTVINPVLRFAPTYTPSPPLQVRSAAQPAPSQPSTRVILGQDTRIADADTYNARGVVATPGRYAWEQDSTDKLSIALLGGIQAKTNGARFQGLGAALLGQLASNGGQNISQSVFTVSDTLQPGTEALKLQQARLREDPDNGISFKLTTASGATVNLVLASNEKGLAVSADVQDGQLNEAELQGLADLADAFQGAINGLTEQPPRLQLGSLVNLDPTLFSSLRMSAKFDVQGEKQTFDLNLNDQARSVSLQGPSGNLQLNLDTRNSALLGSTAQRQAAIDNYLTQFDAAQSRGKGDEGLMNLFKDAFTQLNSVDAKRKPTIELASSLSDGDRALLSGLSDFSASISKAGNQINPMRPSETDRRFDYNVSQTTNVSGGGPLNRSVQQDTQASLKASFHEGLNPLVDLRLGLDRQSQNYRYHEISDQASSSTRLAYNQGKLVEASATQQATRNERVRTYIDGVLKDDISTPTSVNRSRNLRILLNEVFQQERAAQRENRASVLDEALKAQRSNWLLQTDPSKITA